MVSVSQNFECDSVNDRGLPMSLSIKSLSLSSVLCRYYSSHKKLVVIK